MFCKICSGSKFKKIGSITSTYHKSPSLVLRYLGYLKLYKIGAVFKICIWISVFRRKKQFVNPLHSSKVTTILLMQKNSGVFFKHPVCLIDFEYIYANYKKYWTLCRRLRGRVSSPLSHWTVLNIFSFNISPLSITF